MAGKCLTYFEEAITTSYYTSLRCDEDWKKGKERGKGGKRKGKDEQEKEKEEERELLLHVCGQGVTADAESR